MFSWARPRGHSKGTLPDPSLSSVPLPTLPLTDSFNLKSTAFWLPGKFLYSSFGCQELIFLSCSCVAHMTVATIPPPIPTNLPLTFRSRSQDPQSSVPTRSSELLSSPSKPSLSAYPPPCQVRPRWRPKLPSPSDKSTSPVRGLKDDYYHMDTETFVLPSP